MIHLKKINFFAFVLFTAYSFQAQIGMGTWRLHVATGKAIDVANSDQYIFTAYENGILRYDFDTKEKKIYTEEVQTQTKMGYHLKKKLIY